MVIFGDILSQVSAGDRRGAWDGGKLLALVQTRNWKTNRKKYDRSQYVFENKRWQFENELKRTQERTQIGCSMRALNPRFERFDVAHVPAGALDCGKAAGFEIVRLAEIRRRGREYKNSGNELKKCFKMKDITFSSTANYAHFAHTLAQNRARKEQRNGHFAKTNRSRRLLPW